MTATSVAADLGARRALVTGASSGLGIHFAHLLARGGIGGLALAGRRLDRFSTVADQCRALGASDVCALELDVVDPGAITRCFAQARSRLGGIDLLVDNAGIAATAPALETSPAGFDSVLEVKLRGARLCAVEAARGMCETGGDIVNITSILGLRIAGGGMAASQA